MAVLRLALLTALWSARLAGSLALRSQRLPGQDGTGGGEPGAHPLPAETDARPVAPARWEWLAPGESRHGAPQAPRRQRQAGTALPATPTGTVSRGKAAGPSSDAATASTAPLRTLSQDVANKTNARLSASKSAKLPPGPTTTPPLSSKKGGTKDNPASGPVVEETTAVPAEAGDAPSTPWPWLEEFSTSVPLLDGPSTSTADLSRGFAGAKRTPASPHAAAAASSSSSSSSSSSTTTTTEEPWLEELSTASSMTVGDPSTSTANQSRGEDTDRSLLGRKVNQGFAATTAAARSPPAQAPPPGAGSPGSSLVGQCLLAILLLALVAAVFIVATAVLATLLWRQRQAYRLTQRGPTEMVCISSLLAAEEAEEAARRGPRVKHVRMLGEPGSETEMDNLTLNSFLPEH